jgi:hypothetical protein
MLILYVRVSTNNFEQITSINNQLEVLKNYIKLNNLNNYKYEIVTEVKSISNGISETIKDLVKKYGKINIIVTHMDRFTRDLSDVKFIKDNVETITVIENNKIYFPKNDWKEIANMNISSTEEIEKIKLRITTGSKKRKQSDIHDLCSNAHKRVKSINKIILEDNNTHIINNIIYFIQRSQLLQSKVDWTSISNIYKMYTKKDLMLEYPNINFNLMYHIKKNELILFVNNILNSSNININNCLLKEFINANIYIIKKTNISNDEFSDILTGKLNI